jgi:outer membrane immunogenic protein
MQGVGIMQRWLLGTAAALAMAGPSIAADLRAAPVVKAPPAPPPVVYNWTGCYVDGGGGYGFSNGDSFTTTNGVGSSARVTNGGRGWFGTVGGGCDVQFGQRWVLGAFGNYDFADIKGDVAVPDTNLVGREKQDSAWAVGGRLGYTLTPTILTYVNGGYTQARFNGFGLSSQTDGTPTGLNIDAHTYSGWFVGSGFEYNLGFMPGLFWRTEYRFAQYGRDTLPILNGAGAATDTSLVSDKTIQTIRSELVWRFNFGGGRY